MAKSTGAARRPTALSLHLGLNAVSPRHYDGWAGELDACEQDARDMAALAKSRGMKPTILLTKRATRARTLTAVSAAAARLARGDLFFLTYSGHGGQVRDVTGEEDDRRDETWCLFDSQLIDDELYAELTKFKAGVRILVLSDSCHSGTMTRAASGLAGTIGRARSKMLPPRVAEATYEKHKELYDSRQMAIASRAGGRAVAEPDAVLAALALDPRLPAVAGRIKASAILISGCQDNQTSLDGHPNGAFTGALLKVWNQGGFKGTYPKFHAEIVRELPPSQTPNLFPLGPAGRFLRQQPFSV